MSVRVMAKVWDLSRHDGPRLLMMLAIADFADDFGQAYPSIDTLATKCRIKPRNANIILRALRVSGELIITRGAGPRTRGGYLSLYRITLAEKEVQGFAPLPLPAESEGVQETVSKGCKKPSKGVRRFAPKPL